MFFASMGRGAADPGSTVFSTISTTILCAQDEHNTEAYEAIFNSSPLEVNFTWEMSLKCQREEVLGSMRLADRVDILN